MADQELNSKEKEQEKEHEQDNEHGVNNDNGLSGNLSNESEQISVRNKNEKNGSISKRSLFHKAVNVFIGIFLGLILTSLILVGFTQTKTFREFLREKVIALVNEKINGKFNIEKLDGTIFTSLFLKNTSIIFENDTLFFAKNVELKASPLQILLKKIFVRKVLIDGVKIAMLQDPSGSWNFSKLIKPEPEDTAKSSFPFLIHVNDLQLHNIKFIRQMYANRNSLQYYQYLNSNDLRIDNLHFAAQAFADIDNSDYLLEIKEFSFMPNLTRFSLKNISGAIAITKNFASINNFYFITDSSQINLSARIDSLNLFSNVQLEDFKNYPVTISAQASPFNFSDLSSFIEETELLKGNPSLELRARGKFGNFKIDKCRLDYHNTHFGIEGHIKNLNVPENLFIQAKITDTDFDYKDVNALLPSLKLPEYAQLHLTGVNVEYEGQPTNFKAKFGGNVEDGNLIADVVMNVGSKPMTYNINFETDNLNLSPILKIPTSLSSKGNIVGQGVSPADLLADLTLKINNSHFGKYSLDNFSADLKSKDRIINLNVTGKSGLTNLLLKGDIIFDKETIPEFNLIGRLNNLNLASFLNDKKYESNFNFYFSADGKNFNPDEMNAKFNFGIDSSTIRNKKINNSNIQCIVKKESSNREIAITSDLLDFKIDGDFSLNKAIELVTYEASTISGIVTQKINDLNPLTIVKGETISDSLNTILPDIINDNLKFNYDFKFKDFELIALLIGDEKIDIAGNGKGIVKNENGNFSVTNETNIDYLVMVQSDATIYLSDLSAELNFTRNNKFLSFDKLFGTASLTGKRFYSGSNVKSITADLTFNQSKLFFSSSANIEDLFFVEGDGVILMTPSQQQLLVDKLSFSYNNIEWNNKDSIKVFFNPQFFKIQNLKMFHDDSEISLNGIIESTGRQNLEVEASKISGEILEKYLFGFKDNQLIANGSINGKIIGQLDNPVMDFNFNLADLQIKTTKLGKLIGFFNYSDKKLTSNISFLDSTSNTNSPLLTMTGYVPINLAFAGVKERLLKDQPLSFQIKSTSFDLNSLGRILPGIVNQKGILKADVNLNGTFNRPKFSGYLNLNDGFFRAAQNNLDYKFNLNVQLSEQEIKLIDLRFINAGGSKYVGTLYSAGTIKLDAFKIKDIDIHTNGELAVLGQQSQSVNPFIYGDLVIGAKDDWVISNPNGKVTFKADVFLKDVDLVYTTGQENNTTANKNINFVFVQDSTRIDKELIRFQQVLTKEKSLQQQVEQKPETQLDFDYEIRIISENRSKLVFILSQAVNQKLTVEMQGDLRYSNLGGLSRAQGAFELLQGSKLEFFKTFDAVGFIRFESDMTNPFLDITATYTGDYINPREQSGVPQDVAVRIKLKSPLSELGKSLAGNPESIGVYVGQQNIQNNIKEPRYDYSDAFSFILIGKFKDDLTAQDKAQVAGQTNAIGNTATSFLGSVLTNFVNSAVGDLVNNISINQSGEYTKFSLSGRIQNLRYSFGGTTEVFQNIGKANIKVEYLFNPRFLIRLERKDPIVNSFSSDEKINEMALKYKFEF